MNLPLVLLADAPLAVSIEGGARMGLVSLTVGLTVGLGIVLASAWRRRRSRAKDPFRSLEPPAGPLRLAQDLKARSTTD